MRVCIIMAAYNAEKYIGAAIDTVLAQTYHNWTLMVIDDGSCDSTATIVQRYAALDSRICLLSKENGGVSSARNLGLEKTDAAFDALGFLDADDLWEPDALQLLVAALNAVPSAVGAHGFARYVDAEGRPHRIGELEAKTRERKALCGSRLISLPPNAPTTYAALAYWDWIPIGTALVRRSAASLCGPFDRTLTHAEDWDWWLRLARGGAFAFVDQLVLSYRRHESNATSQTRAAAQGEQAIVHARALDPASTPEQRRLVVAGYRLRERSMWRERLRWGLASLIQKHPLEAAKHLRHSTLSLFRSLLPDPLLLRSCRAVSK